MRPRRRVERNAFGNSRDSEFTVYWIYGPSEFTVYWDASIVIVAELPASVYRGLLDYEREAAALDYPVLA